MKTVVLALLAGAAALALSSCAATGGAEQQILGSWHGAPVEQIFRRWGLPNRRASLAGGKTLYEWDHSQSITFPGSTTGTATVIGNTAYVNTQTRPPSVVTGACTRSIVAESDGLVSEGYSRGDNCCVMAIAGYCASLLNPASPPKPARASSQ